MYPSVKRSSIIIMRGKMYVFFYLQDKISIKTNNSIIYILPSKLLHNVT